MDRSPYRLEDPRVPAAGEAADRLFDMMSDRTSALFMGTMTQAEVDEWHLLRRVHGEWRAARESLEAIIEVVNDPTTYAQAGGFGIQQLAERGLAGKVVDPFGD